MAGGSGDQAQCATGSEGIVDKRRTIFTGLFSATGIWLRVGDSRHLCRVPMQQYWSLLGRARIIPLRVEG